MVNALFLQFRAVRNDVVKTRFAKAWPKGLDQFITRRVDHPAIQHRNAPELALADAIEIERGFHVLAVDQEDANRPAVKTCPHAILIERLPDAQAAHGLLQFGNVFRINVGGYRDAFAAHVIGNDLAGGAHQPIAAITCFQHLTVARNLVETETCSGHKIIRADTK